MERNGGHYCGVHVGGWAKGMTLGKVMYDLFHHYRYLENTCTCIIVFWVPCDINEGYGMSDFMPRSQPGSVVIGTWERVDLSEDIHFVHLNTWDGNQHNHRLAERGMMITENSFMFLDD